MQAVYKGYWGMGIMMESFLSKIIVLKMKWTPWEAPSVRIISSIEGWGTESDLAINLATLSLTRGIPREWV
jgi:hypothetical protein